MAEIIKQYLDLEGTETLVGKVKEADAKVLSDAKEYADDLADNYDAAGTAETKVNALANGQVKTNTEAIAAINNDATGILAQAKSYADNGDASVQANVDALEALVGTIPEGYTSTTIAAYAKELADAVAANGYDDTVLAARVTTTENAIATLNGTGVGSVSKQVADAVAAIVADAPEAYDTLKEISDWISSHASDASAMNTQINTNKTDIANLVALVGSLPEGAASTTIVAYIAEAIGASETDLTSAIATAKSEAISTAATDATTKANQALADAKTYADGKDSAIAAAQTSANAAQADVDALEEKVGTIADGKTVVQMISDAKAEATYDDTTVKNSINANTNAIEAIEADYLKSADKAELETSIQANTEAISALTPITEAELLSMFA